MGRPDPTATLQPVAERVRAETGTDFVVVMSPGGRRYTHPDPRQIGQQFIGHIRAAQRGGEVTESYRGTLGPSVRAVVPVEQGRRVVALVAVGIRRTAVTQAVGAQLPALGLAGALAAALSGLGTWLVARRVRRQTHGLGAAQLQDMYDYYDAVLHAVREGLLLVDGAGRVRLVNDECRRLLDLPGDVVGRPVAELGLTPTLERTLVEGTPRLDELHVTSARVLVLNQARARWKGRDLGTVVDHPRPHRPAGPDRRARHRPRAHRGAALAGARVGQPAAHGRLPDRARPGAGGAASSPPRSCRWRSGSPTRSSAPSTSRPSPRCCSASRPRPASAASTSSWATTRSCPTASPRRATWSRSSATSIDNAFDAVATVGGEKVVRFDAGVHDGYAVLTVTDTGPGVPRPDRGAGVPARLVHQGRRGGARGGRGLGLALVAQSVERLGGSIEVAGPPGARFTVRLPVPGGQP